MSTSATASLIHELLTVKTSRALFEANREAFMDGRELSHDERRALRELDLDTLRHPSETVGRSPPGGILNPGRGILSPSGISNPARGIANP